MATSDRKGELLWDDPAAEVTVSAYVTPEKAAMVQIARRSTMPGGNSGGWTFMPLADLLRMATRFARPPGKVYVSIVHGDRCMCMERAGVRWERPTTVVRVHFDPDDYEDLLRSVMNACRGGWALHPAELGNDGQEGRT